MVMRNVILEVRYGTEGMCASKVRMAEQTGGTTPC